MRPTPYEEPKPYEMPEIYFELCPRFGPLAHELSYFAYPAVCSSSSSAHESSTSALKNEARKATIPTQELFIPELELECPHPCMKIVTSALNPGLMTPNSSF